MLLRDIKLIDLNRSVLDTDELDELLSKKKDVETKLGKLKEPKAEQAKTKYFSKKAELTKQVEKLNNEAEKVREQYGKNRKLGNYTFKKKVYVSWNDPATRPQHYVKWNRNTPYDVEGWRTKWNYSEVTINDPYWPEGVKPNQEGHYVYRTDMILMKCPLKDYVMKRAKEIEKSEFAVAAKRREYEELVKLKGSEAPTIEDRVYSELK